ncbi:MAG: hypothetical protein ACOYM2_07755 [Rectinemataceae bacterium]
MRAAFRVLPAICLALLLPLLFSSCQLISRLLPDKVEVTATKALSLLGRINIDSDAVFSTVNKGMMVVAQTVSANSQTIRAFTDAVGSFSLDISEELKGSEFIISLVDASGRAIGPIMKKTDQVANGFRSVGMKLGSSLAKIDFGDIRVAASGLAETVGVVQGVNSVADLVARVTAAGAPVGLAAHGKGAAAQSTTTSTRQANDRDQDGLIDILDADDDGDGILDDFDTDSTTVGMPTNYKVDVGFWLNPTDSDYQMFYHSTPAKLREFVKGKYILELWFNVTNDSEAATIKTIALDTRSMPAYSSILVTGPDSNPSQQVLWSAPGMGGMPAYQLMETPQSTALPQGGKQWKNRLIVPVGQKADLQAGDLFNFEITKKDGTKLYVSQMLNFVFTNIPLLRYIGTGSDPAKLQDFTALMDKALVTPNAMVPGSMNAPIVVADNSDVTVRFQPPVDDMEQPILQGSYRISIIPYRTGSGPSAQVWNIATSTWPSGPPADYYNNKHLMLEIPVSQMTRDAASGLFTLVVPKACFPGSVTAWGETTAFTPTHFSIGIVSLVNYSQTAFTVFVKK